MSNGEIRPKVKPGSSLLRRICAFFRPSSRRETRPAPAQSNELRPPMLTIPTQYFQQVFSERPAPYSPIGELAADLDRPMLTWTQSVRRLNTEYHSTVNALERMKEYLQGISAKEATPHFISRPRFVQRMDLNRFPVLAIIEKDETDQLSVKSSTTEVRQVESEEEEKEDWTLESISEFKGRVPSLSSTEEETTYTVETFYGKAGDQQQLVVVSEETTEEQFNAAQEKSSSIDDSTIVLIKHHVEMKEPLSSSSTERKVLPRTIVTRGIATERAHLLRWCQQQLSDYPKISVTNLSSSWSDGLALCALVHHFYPSAFDFHRLTPSNPKRNFQLAFRTVDEQLGIPGLVNPSDTSALFTYLHLFSKQMKEGSSTRSARARAVPASTKRDRECVQ